MAKRSILYEISLEGAQQAKQELDEFNKTLREGGSVDMQEYSRAQRQVTMTSRGMINEERRSQQLFLAMHPNIRKTSEALGTFSRVSGVTMNVMNSINMAQLLMNNNSTKELEMKNKLTDATRQY